ncbi:MAG: 2-deoxyribose-5-phosphate aldolase, partial [Dermatophilaceae bacterium]
MSAATTTAADPTERARDLLGVSRLTNSALTGWLHGLPGVDQVGCEGRAAALGTRSIKTTSKAWAVDTAISMVDLTTLEGADTPGRVRGLAAKALVPDPSDTTTPRPAAVCVYGDMVGVAKEVLGGSDVKVAAVATAFPSGRASLAVKLADTRDAVAAGADEIDMVIDRGAFLAGNYLTVFRQIVETKAVCGAARLKVIMETGELVTYDNVRRASWLSMLAG